MREIAAREDDGHVIAAIPEVALAKPPPKNQAAWIGNAQNLRNLGLAFANSQGAQKAKLRWACHYTTH
jgi:hypothetical protein